MIPGLRQLQAMPGVFRSVLAGITHEDACWKPAPHRWSVLEVIEHLAHVEVFGFRQRLERMVQEDSPTLASYDPDALMASGVCRLPDLPRALDAFQRERTRSLEVLTALSPGDLLRGGTHAEFGSVTVGELLHEWPFHDLGHLRQICEVLRTRKFYPHLGPWQRIYTVNP